MPVVSPIGVRLDAYYRDPLPGGDGLRKQIHGHAASAGQLSLPLTYRTGLPLCFCCVPDNEATSWKRLQEPVRRSALMWPPKIDSARSYVNKRVKRDLARIRLVAS